jgi:eukaryotic translation initiation factor 2-alpha kinase 4
MKKKDGIVINLVQDFVLGTSVFGISSSIGWSSDGIRMVAKGIVDALIYLHNNGVSHSWLYDTSVFMDNTGHIRVTDFGLVSFLQELVGGAKTFKSDLLALGALIESLSINISSEMKDFIEKYVEFSDKTRNKCLIHFIPDVALNEHYPLQIFLNIHFYVPFCWTQNQQMH